MDSKDNKIVIYQVENGVTKISVRFADKDLWLTQAQLTEVYDATQQNISQQWTGFISTANSTAKRDPSGKKEYRLQ